MKDNFNREWLEGYKVNPRRDNIIYKNYQSPSAPTTDTSLLAGLSPLQRGRYAQFINDTPSEVKTLSAAAMQKYLQEANEREQKLRQEKIAYDRQTEQVKTQQAQRQNQLRAQQQAEAQRQNQLRAQQQAEAQRQNQLRAQQQAEAQRLRIITKKEEEDKRIEAYNLKLKQAEEARQAKLRPRRTGETDLLQRIVVLQQHRQLPWYHPEIEKIKKQLNHNYPEWDNYKLWRDSPRPYNLSSFYPEYDSIPIKDGATR